MAKRLVSGEFKERCRNMYMNGYINYRSIVFFLFYDGSYFCVYLVIVIASDGESSDGDLLEAMQPLKDLPGKRRVILLCKHDHQEYLYFVLLRQCGWW